MLSIILKMQEALQTYLNDHLSGSVVALGLLDYFGQSPPEGTTSGGIQTLRDDIAADQQLLRDFLHHWGGHETFLKQAGAWAAEKMTHLKLRLSASSGSDLGALEAFEILSLGIEGKAGLWKALAEIAPHYDVLNQDWAHLVERAAQQRELVETWRLQAAGRAFVSESTQG